MSGLQRINRERGSSMMEFCFTIPVLLMVAGSTVDVSRYMRFLQITTFVSQESGSEIYQQCSDLTIYQKPVAQIGTASSQLQVDRDRTIIAIALCAKRIQDQAQLVLNKSLGRSSLSSNVYRANITQANPSQTCSGIDGMERIAIRANLLDGTTSSALDPRSYNITQFPRQDDCDRVTKDPIRIIKNSNDEGRGGDTPGSTGSNNIDTANLLSPKLDFNSDSGLTYRQPSGSQRRLISRDTMCQRGRVVAVEVAYDFDPIVKFLPEMIVKLDGNGNQREISIF